MGIRIGSRTEYPTSGIPSGGNAQRLECPTLNFFLGIHDNTPRIPNDAIPNHRIPNDAIPNDRIPNNFKNKVSIDLQCHIIK